MVVRSSEAEDDGAGNGERQEVTERNLEQTLSRRQVRAFEALFAATFVRTSCAGCHGDVVVNSSPRRTLVNLLNNGWVRTGAPIKDQTLWQRLSGEGGVRIMPPPNARPLDATGLNSVRSWLRGL